MGSKNKIKKSFIGQGYYNTHTPSVILRNLFENPGWYTQYTPYQAEISQGRLELLFNFQTLITELTGLEIANASLLDESTATAEAMALAYRCRSKDQIKQDIRKVIVAEDLFPQTLEVLKTRAKNLNIELIFKPFHEIQTSSDVFACIVQYQNNEGKIQSLNKLSEIIKDPNIKLITVTDLLALTVMASPGELGADIAVGSSQRFGVPMGFGGPHAAFFATKKDYVRQIPGRIIGLSIDKYDKPAFRMALQTREQHIRKEKATSNICTAQALLANMAAAYAIYHGPKGLIKIANKIHQLASSLKNKLQCNKY